jgi:hypothetical protein
MHLCKICSEILEKFRRHVLAQYGAAPWHAVYTHEVTAGASTLRLSALERCCFCKQPWDSLSDRYHDMLLRSESDGCTVWLFWDDQANQYSKLRFLLDPTVEDNIDTGVMDTSELLSAYTGRSMLTCVSEALLMEVIDLASSCYLTPPPSPWTSITPNRSNHKALISD